MEGREKRFSPDLLRMMLTEEREKFLSALEAGSSWKELSRIRKNISQLNQLIDESRDIEKERWHQGSSGGYSQPSPERH